MFLRLAAFNSKRLYIGLVSVRPSVCPPVCPVDRQLLVGYRSISAGAREQQRTACYIAIEG